MNRLPLTTYRLQLHRGFTFENAREVVPYLADLGITDCYASPFLRARPGSTHGYDICDHGQINPEIGDEEAYNAFSEALHAADMGQVADFVPNHMAADSTINQWWRDVLENGRCSRYSRFFDIDWDPLKEELKQRVLLPILGDQYGAALERGEFHLDFVAGRFTIRYFEHDLPVNPRPSAMVLRHRIDALEGRLGSEHVEMREYLSIVTALERLPPYTAGEPEQVVEREREKEVAGVRLQRLARGSPTIAAHIAENVRIFNGEPGRHESFDLLHQLLEAQPYRLSYWRTAPHEINYRRFFDINALAGLRMEEPDVFVATHGLVLRLIRDGHVTGLRLDHVDGLHDPPGYLNCLQYALRAEPGHPTPYVVAEKILSAGELLPPSWPVHGTSGYDFLNDANGLFVDSRNARAMQRVYERFTHRRASFADVAYESKKFIMQTSMASELNVLARALNRISEEDRCTRDFSLNSLREVLLETVACFPVYRTYVNQDGVVATDRTSVDLAIERARRRNPTMEPSIVVFLHDVLLPERGAVHSEAAFRHRLSFAMKLQQYTGPVQAKGVEDTAFYRHNVLLCLNEVGGDPDRFGRSPDEFHAANAHRRRHWPLTMLATATHDTKRGEDARARLAVLSEVPDDWRRALSRWARVNSANRALVEGQPAPDRNDEYLFYQALLGSWPAEGADWETAPPGLVERLSAYMIKAVREAKLHTSWITQNAAYETAVRRFVERTLSGASRTRFFASFAPFHQRIARLGATNSLAQLLLKIVSPGVPDFYQGSELWDLSLVDPDNRRPVDYAQRRSALRGLLPLIDACRAGTANPDPAESLLAAWPDGRIKLFVTACGLRLRRELADVFRYGSYQPLPLEGPAAHHAVAVLRQQAGHSIVALAPRLVSQLLGGEDGFPLGETVWRETRLLFPPSASACRYRNLLTGENLETVFADCAGALSLARVFRILPVALLLATHNDPTHGAAR